MRRRRIAATLFFLMTTTTTTTVLSGAVSEKRFGICYDPLHDLNAYHTNGVATVLTRDLLMIGQRFAAVRTFQAVYDNVEVGPYIAQAGLKATIGINTEVHDAFLWQQMNAAIRAATDPRRYVVMIAVGNENLHKGTPASKLIWIIKHIQAHVPGHVRVGTVQRPNEYLELSGGIAYLSDLVQVSDVIGLNVYPFFSNLGAGGSSTVDMLNAQWDQVQRKFPAAKMVLTETGWPDQGGRNFANNTASPHDAAAYYEAFRQQFFGQGSAGAALAPEEVYYFQYFNQPYKGGQFEPHFGLTDPNGARKPSFRF